MSHDVSAGPQDRATGPDATAQLQSMQQALLAQLDEAPLESLCAFVGAASAVFYWAEAGHNPRVADYWDALHYIATSLSVGYANIFPVTPVGKIIGALVMMVGPALSSRALDGGAAKEEATHRAALIGRLDDLLVELRQLSATLGSGATAP